MGLIYIADTNIVSELMKPAPNQSVEQKWQRHLEEIGLTSISWHELQTGVERLPASKNKKRQALRAFLNRAKTQFPILPYDQQAAEWHALERTRLMGEGLTPSYIDGQIAAITATKHLVLVTRNVGDFENFQNLTIENWFA